MAVVDPAALLIGLREGLEALLILGILLGLLRRLGHADKSRHVWWGAAAGAGASVVLGLAVQAAFATWFEETGAAAFEVVVALVAVGILTYMVLWMQKHTTQLLGTVKERAQAAASEGRWILLAGLAFFTVFREGIEMVLFYAARLADLGWPSLLLSGALGLAASALLAFLIFRLTVQVSLRGFFGVTGFLLIFIAAGLLVHSAHAAADLGWIPHGEALWDTSGALPDEGHWLGGPLHAFFGYVDQPTALQLLLYLGYVIGVGGWYATRLATPKARPATTVAAAALFLLVLSGFAVAGALPDADHATEAHGHGDEEPGHGDVLAAAVEAMASYDGKVGVLVRSHGEPIHYNATTYESFRAFMESIWPYTGLPAELLSVDQGTILMDEAHPYDDSPHLTDGRFVDAWLGTHAAALPVADPLGTGATDLCGGTFYLLPGPGPGLGEGDLFEMCALGVYKDYLKMENASPMYNATASAWDLLAARMEKTFGDRVTVAFAHHIDPKVDPEETTEAAARRLADAGVDVVVDAYMSSVRSDAMDTCMMAPHTAHALEEAGFAGPILQAGLAGTHEMWGDAAAHEVERLLESYSQDEPVAVYLSQHGGDPTSQNPCGEGADQYHANTRAEYAVAEAAIQAMLGDRPVTVRQVYGQGAGAPDDGVLSPLEAIALDREAGVREVVILPYEFWGDALDNLVYLRESLGFTPDEAPYYGADHTTRMTLDGVNVLVASAEYGTETKVEALLVRIGEAIVEATGGEAESGHGPSAHR